MTVALRAVRDNDGLRALDLPSLEGGGEAEGVELLVEANARLERLGLGALVSTRRHLVIGTGTPEEPRGNPALATVDLSKLVLLQGYLFMVLNERLEELRTCMCEWCAWFVLRSRLARGRRSCGRRPR